MKKIAVFLSVLSISFTPLVLAQEGILTESPSLLQLRNEPLRDSFSVVVTSDGKLTVKPGEVFTEGQEASGTQLPYLVSKPKSIQYPKAAIDQGWQGKIVIAVEILADGSFGQYQVMHSTGHQILDEAAVQTLQSWKFHPAVQAGKAFRTCIQIPVTFQLQSE